MRDTEGSPLLGGAGWNSCPLSFRGHGYAAALAACSPQCGRRPPAAAKQESAGASLLLPCRIVRGIGSILCAMHSLWSHLHVLVGFQCCPLLQPLPQLEPGEPGSLRRRGWRPPAQATIPCSSTTAGGPCRWMLSTILVVDSSRCVHVRRRLQSGAAAGRREQGRGHRTGGPAAAQQTWWAAGAASAAVAAAATDYTVSAGRFRRRQRRGHDIPRGRCKVVGCSVWRLAMCGSCRSGQCRCSSGRRWSRTVDAWQCLMLVICCSWGAESAMCMHRHGC